MRPSVLFLLLIALILPGFGAEPGRESLLNGLNGSLERLRQVTQALVGKALSVELTLDPRLEEHLGALRADLAKQVTALADQDGDAEPVRRALIAAQIKINALARLEHKLTEYVFAVGRFASLADSPYLTNYRALLREHVQAHQARAIAGSDPEEVEGAARVRLRRLELVLTLSEREQRVAQDHPLLDPAKPPLAGYLAWSRQVREVTAAALAQPAAEVSEQDLYRGDDAVTAYQGRMSDWVALLKQESRLREALEPGNDGPAGEALRANLVKQVELMGERGRILDERHLHRDGQAAEAAAERLRQIARELGQLEAADDQLASAQVNHHQLIGLRDAIAAKLAQCPEGIRKTLTGRLEQIVAAHVKEQARQLRAQAAEDRVDAAEAEGELLILDLRLRELSDEAFFESGQAEAQQAWRGREQEPGVRDLAKRYQDTRERLAKVRAKQLQMLVAQQQTQNRITMLQLKIHLTDTRVEEGAATMQRLREELDQLHQVLGEAAEKAGERAKDAKDAERIPLEKADDF